MSQAVLPAHSRPKLTTLRCLASEHSNTPHCRSFLPASLRFSRDFCIPQAPAALLKAALIGAGIISLAPAAGAAAAPPRTRRDSASDSPAPDDQAPRPSAGSMMAGDDTDNPVTPSLEEQLGRVFGAGGIRITSRSGLPQGSGMGTSSILAGERRWLCPPFVLLKSPPCFGCPTGRCPLPHAS